MRWLLCVMIVSIAAPARADWCGRVGRMHERSDAVTTSTRVGDVRVAAGGTIEWDALVAKGCVVTGRQVGIVRLARGGEVCGVTVRPGMAVQLQYPLTAIDGALPARRMMLLHAPARTTVQVKDLVLVADHLGLACTTAGPMVTHGILARSGIVFGVKLDSGTYFSGSDNCLGSLDLARPTQIGVHRFPREGRIHFDRCRPTSLQLLGERDDEFTHDGVTCILAQRSRSVALHPTGKIQWCEQHHPFDTMIAGVTRRVVGGFGTRFHPDGTLEQAKLADDRFFGAFLVAPDIEVAPTGQVVRVIGTLRQPHVFGSVRCGVGTVIFDGKGTVTRCDP